MNNSYNRWGTIGVLMGGYSSEREISLKSGRAVFVALKEAGCQVKPLDVVSLDLGETERLIQAAKIDLAFIALHGELGEDGVIQSLLEKIDIPYTGSGIRASQLALNKVLSKEVFKGQHIPTPEAAVVSQGKGVDHNRLASGLKWPVLVKPACEGSSIGITLVEKMEQLEEALTKAFQFDKTVLVESYIRGRELTVGILDEEALPIVEIRPKNKFFDFQAKYEKGMSEYIVPALLPGALAQKIQEIALAAHQALGCQGFSRVDVMLDEGATPYVLEINTIPGFTSTSLLPKAAQARGINFRDLCLRLVELAYSEGASERQKTRSLRL